MVDLIYIAIEKLTGKDIRDDISIDIDLNKFVCSELIAFGIKEAYGYDINYATFEPQGFIVNNNMFDIILELG